MHADDFLIGYYEALQKWAEGTEIGGPGTGRVPYGVNKPNQKVEELSLQNLRQKKLAVEREFTFGQLMNGPVTPSMARGASNVTGKLFNTPGSMFHNDATMGNIHRRMLNKASPSVSSPSAFGQTFMNQGQKYSALSFSNNTGIIETKTSSIKGDTMFSDFFVRGYQDTLEKCAAGEWTGPRGQSAMPQVTQQDPRAMSGNFTPAMGKALGRQMGRVGRTDDTMTRPGQEWAGGRGQSRQMGTQHDSAIAALRSKRPAEPTAWAGAGGQSQMPQMSGSNPAVLGGGGGRRMDPRHMAPGTSPSYIAKQERLNKSRMLAQGGPGGASPGNTNAISSLLASNPYA